MLASEAKPGLAVKASPMSGVGGGGGGTGSLLRVSREKIPPRFSGGASGGASAIASALIRAS